MEVDSPSSVSSEESTGLRCPSDHKAVAEIEGMDLDILCEDDCVPLDNAPWSSPLKSLDFPKDLVSVVKDCGIILVKAI